MVASLDDALLSTSKTVCIAGERPTMRPKRSSIVRVRTVSAVSMRTGILPVSAARAPWEPDAIARDIDRCRALLDRKCPVTGGNRTPRCVPGGSELVLRCPGGDGRRAEQPGLRVGDHVRRQAFDHR